MDLNLPVASDSCESGPGLHVHRVDDALLERRLERAEGQVVLVVAPQPQLGRVLHLRAHHLGLVVPVVRVGELDDLHVVAGHAVQPEHQLDALLLLDAPPVGLDLVLAAREADLLALEVGHPVDVVPGAHHHHAALARRVRHAQEPRAADVGLDVDRREQAAEADQVVEVVDVVRVPVVLLAGAEVQVLDPDLLVLLLRPAELLVDVGGGDQRAVGVVHLVPAKIHAGERLSCDDRLRHCQFLSCLRVTRRSASAVPLHRLVCSSLCRPAMPAGAGRLASPIDGSSNRGRASVVGVLEDRLAALVEGADAVDAVGMHGRAPVGLHHDRDRLLDRLPVAHVDGPLDGLHRCR